LKEGNCVYAAPWFRKASAWSADSSEDAATARGLALALRKVGAFREAEELAYAWRDRDPEMDAIYIDIGVEQLTSEAPALKLSEPRIQRLATRVLEKHHVGGARALGWWRYRLERFRQARRKDRRGFCLGATCDRPARRGRGRGPPLGG
jgi:hypothetical protein